LVRFPGSSLIIHSIMYDRVSISVLVYDSVSVIVSVRINVSVSFSVSIMYDRVSYFKK